MPVNPATIRCITDPVHRSRFLTAKVDDFSGVGTPRTYEYGSAQRSLPGCNGSGVSLLSSGEALCSSDCS
jgi:hypothetical protein